MFKCRRDDTYPKIRKFIIIKRKLTDIFHWGTTACLCVSGHEQPRLKIRLPNRGPEASGPVQQRIGIGTTVTRGPVAYNIVEQIPV